MIDTKINFLKISNAELCAMWLNDEIPLSEYMKNFKDSPAPRGDMDGQIEKISL